MNFLADFGIVTALIVGPLLAALVGAVIIARIGLAVRAWLDRNN